MTQRIEYLEYSERTLSRRIAANETVCAKLTDEYLEQYKNWSGIRDLVASRKKSEGWLKRDRPALEKARTELAECRERLASAQPRAELETEESTQVILSLRSGLQT